MRPFSPFCGTVSNAQLLILPDTIRMIAPGVVTTQLSQAPPASSSATDVPESSDRRLATAQPPEPAPTTMKSNVSIDVSPRFIRHCEESCRVGKAKRAHHSLQSVHGGHGADAPVASRHEPHHLLQPRDL